MMPSRKRVRGIAEQRNLPVHVINKTLFLEYDLQSFFTPGSPRC